MCLFAKDAADPAAVSAMKESKTSVSRAEYTDTQRELAEKARQMILSNLERHITIAEFARELHASPTQVKTCFRKVCGMPIYTYARVRRMEAAAKMLEETDDSVLEIAGKTGYENGSKFAKAFRDVMGVSPGEYRKKILWEREDLQWRESASGE